MVAFLQIIVSLLCLSVMSLYTCAVGGLSAICNM